MAESKKCMRCGGSGWHTCRKCGGSGVKTTVRNGKIVQNPCNGCCNGSGTYGG